MLYVLGADAGGRAAPPFYVVVKRSETVKHRCSPEVVMKLSGPMKGGQRLAVLAEQCYT